MAKIILLNNTVTRKANAAKIDSMGIDIDRPIMNRHTHKIIGWHITGNPRQRLAAKSPAGGAP
ncbi:hypothetical protein N9913_02455 [Porticoccaceae bacterium]|nr:hypothetical protein [Porticoccaceae bacterium]